ncbi:hypothetical protein PG994_011683 [Apiospora phragmitis]|uniref:Ricin B lectin domain-containing protein n=1 Tax=Apiospora phragmitis TaxID=2905665 RepID=A0ABR1TW27_9PEZI
MVAKYSAAFAAVMSTLVTAGPVSYPRVVTELNQAAFEEAQKRDETATRAFSNTTIKTSDGKCLFVDKLSGDFRANLTPVQVAECGSTDGQGWDIITQGEHNNVAGSMLVVNTLTQACLNFDPRRPAGSQVNLFSCGGRADGANYAHPGGLVTNSQLFAFNGAAGPLLLAPDNQKESCLVVTDSKVDIAACDDGMAGQSFTFAGADPISKRQGGPDIVTKTELVYVTQRPSEAAEPSFSSTTTIFVTVGAAPSAPAQGGGGTIPQVSINPTTTVVMNPGNGAGGQPAPTSAKASTKAPKKAPASSAPAASAPAGGAGGGIPQVSIGPSGTVTLNPGNGAGAAPALTSVGAGAGKAASSTSAKAKAPASSAPVASAPAASAPAGGAAGGIPQVSIGPSATVTLNPGNGAAPAPTNSAGAGAGAGKAAPTTSAKAKVPASSAPAAPAPSVPAAGQPIPQVSINPTTTVTLLA